LAQVEGNISNQHNGTARNEAENGCVKAPLLAVEAEPKQAGSHQAGSHQAGAHRNTPARNITEKKTEKAHLSDALGFFEKTSDKAKPVECLVTDEGWVVGGMEGLTGTTRGIMYAMEASLEPEEQQEEAMTPRTSRKLAEMEVEISCHD